MNQSVLPQIPPVNLSGEWIGYYSGHFDEVIRIDQNEYYVTAHKVTGDDYVPANEVTWQADLRTNQGEGQVAQKGFVNPFFVPGYLKIISPDRIIFYWEDYGGVEFRRDD